jgi:hypothetical protein
MRNIYFRYFHQSACFSVILFGVTASAVVFDGEKGIVISLVVQLNPDLRGSGFNFNFIT